MIERALCWLEMGVELVPIQPKSKNLVPGFGPYLRHIRECDEAYYWFEIRKCNLGLLTSRSGLVALDFDSRSDYAEWQTTAGDLAKSYTTITNRGFHVHFLVGDHADPQLAGTGAAEVKRHGVVMADPSVHPSGLIYRPLDPTAPVLRARFDFSLPSDPPSRASAMPCPEPPPLCADDTVSRIRRGVPIMSIAEQVTDLHSRNGRWYHGLCPLHSEHEPSFWIDVERGAFGCYACKARGDVINLYAALNRLSVGEAIRQLAARL
jgi:hypothetical protein